MIPTFPIAALALASAATALPNLQRRGLPGAVYTCTSPYFTGDCQWTRPDDRCIIAGMGAQAIQSIGPDPGGYCFLYKRSDCVESAGDTIVKFPGLSAPGSVPKFPDVQSLRCYARPAKREDEAVEGKVKQLLAGGVGSADREEHKEEIEAMEKDGFSEGVIGLEKGVYY